MLTIWLRHLAGPLLILPIRLVKKYLHYLTIIYQVVYIRLAKNSSIGTIRIYNGQWRTRQLRP